MQDISQTLNVDLLDKFKKCWSWSWFSLALPWSCLAPNL